MQALAFIINDVRNQKLTKVWVFCVSLESLMDSLMSLKLKTMWLARNLSPFLSITLNISSPKPVFTMSEY